MWLIKSLTPGDWFNLQSLSPPQRWGGIEISNPLITGLVPLATSTILKRLQKLPYWHKLRCGWKEFVRYIKTPLTPLSLRKFKSFRSSVPETGTKTKYIFNHNITFLLVSNKLYLKRLNLSITLPNKKEEYLRLEPLVPTSSKGFWTKHLIWIAEGKPLVSSFYKPQVISLHSLCWQLVT